MLDLKIGKVPALIDTGAQLSCMRSDVVEFIGSSRELCTFKECLMSCLLADGTRSEITRAVEVRIKLLEYSWKLEFKILKKGPAPVILGLDFLRLTKMTLDVASRKYSFGFAPERWGQFCDWNDVPRGDSFLQQLAEEASRMSNISWPRGVNTASILNEFPQLFSSVLGTAKCPPYCIDLHDRVPVRSAPYRCAPPKMTIFKKMVDELLEQGVVRPSRSPYASPAFLLPKKSGGFRMVVDYRKVNAKIVFDSYPMPTIDQALEQFSGATVFSVLDLNSAYYQIPLSAKSRRITAFCTPFGLFEFNKLPMGISVGCQGLSRVVDELFADLKGVYVYNFLDDLVVYSESPEEHVRHLREVLGRLQTFGFTLNPDKVVLGASEIKYLGHLLSARGVKILPERVVALVNYPRPANLRALRRFIGMVGFYARFIPGYADIVAVLHELKRKGVTFRWGPEHQTAFETLKRVLSEAPVLQIPDFRKEFVLVTDASDLAVSAVLNQKIGEHLAPISYHSRILTPAERRYSIYEKECLAVLFGCEKCRSYVEHKEFELQCDNLALCWLLKNVKDVGRIGRWILRLSPFKFRVKHTRGADNVVADALSRMYEGAVIEDAETSCAVLFSSLPLVYTSLKEHQDQDDFCQELLRKVRSKLTGGAKFVEHRGLLCWFTKNSRKRKWVVPKALRSMLLKYFHDSVFAAHLGAWKTYHKVAAHFWWPKLKEDVFQYVRKCDLCQRAKPAQNQRVGLHSSNPVSRPMERLFIDFVGPLSRTRKGSVAILVVVDSFSKFVSFCPVRNLTAKAAIEYLEKGYFPNYGSPKSIVTDNAKTFCCKAFKDLCFRWGVEHHTTTPYYPQASLAERVNRNLKVALKIFHHESQDRWDEDLAWLSLGFNTAVHESTKSTPDLLFLGREMYCPLKARWDLSPVYNNSGHNATQFWTQAYRNLLEARRKVAHKYDKNRAPHDFKIGDIVCYRLKLFSSKIQNVTAKMMLRWSDPVVIAKFVGVNTALLAHPSTGVIVRQAHVSQIKRYVK